MFALIQEDDVQVTQHAAEKMLVEGLTIKQICRALERGSKFRQTEGHLTVYGYFSVAYKMVSGKYRIKTVFINKER